MIPIFFDFINIYEFHWSDLYYEDFETGLGIRALKMLIENQEKTLVDIKARFDDVVNRDTFFNSLDEAGQASYYGQFFGHEEMVIDRLKQRQRFSCCLSVFSFFEGRLKSICDIVEKSFNFKIKASDLNGSDDLLRYWHYLEKVFEIEMSGIEPFYSNKAT